MDSRSSYRSLVKNIASFNFTGTFTPCELLLVGDKAFPVLVSRNGQVLIAASLYGKGRMVVASHEDILNNPQYLQFVRNAVEWLKPSPEAQVGVHRNLDSLSQSLLSGGVKVVPGATLEASLGVYCTQAYDDTEANNLVQFVKRGGGLLIGGQAWHWASQYGIKNVLHDFPGNQVTSVAGVYFTGNMGETGTIPVSKEMPLVPLVTEHGVDIENDVKSLLNGVTTFSIPEGLPSQMLIHGSLAFPLGVDDSHQSLLAAAHYGKGRVVVASHENLISMPSMKTFVLNAIKWLDSQKQGKVGVAPELEKLHNMLQQAGVPYEKTYLKDGLSVYCCGAYSDSEMAKIHEFVAEGGGLLIGGQAWSWTSDNVLAEYPGNKILNKFGIGILKQDFGASYNVIPARGVASLYHFRKTLFQFVQSIQNKQDLTAPYSSRLKKLAQDCAAFINLPAADSPPFFSVHDTLKELIKQTGIPEVSASKPIKSDSKEAVIIGLATQLYNVFPEFQALVRSMNRNLIPDYPISPPQTIRINGRNDGENAWRSTGLFLPPANTATLLFPPTAINAGLQVLIGCHSDDLSRAEELKRAPVVIRKFAVKSQRMEISSMWGGLLYVIVPKKCALGLISVNIEGAVQAPYFKHGETSPAAWKNTIRQYAAPYAELETENIILTVPTANVRNIENPEILLALWDKMMKAVADLASIPPVFPNPERIVADVQISAGFMHSGYPIMLHLESVQQLLDTQQMYKEGFWGPIHELGHNQQKIGWEFYPHTTEATCNLWSVYVNETVLNIPREVAHTELLPKNRATRRQQYINNGAQLKDFEMFTALEPYLQLQEAFGWEPYKRIFTEYQKMTTIPEDNPSKMNLWAEKFSQQVNKNLAPFFKAWGWPIEPAVSAKLAKSFPTWSENPM